MRMSKVAKLVGVDRRTIYNWITHESLSHLFSEEAKQEGDRDLSEKDIFVINTIHHLRKTLTNEWKEIAEKIESGYQVTELSVGASDVDTGKTPLQQFTRTLTIAQERDAALEQLESARQELKAMREHYEKRLEEERSRGETRAEKLLREIAELRYEIGKLEEKSRGADE